MDHKIKSDSWYIQRDGQRARVLCVLSDEDCLVGGETIIGICSNHDGARQEISWYSDGTIYGPENIDDPMDLIIYDGPVNEA